MVPIVTGYLGTITKCLVQGLEDLEIRVSVDTIRTTALLKSARILTRFLDTWGDLLPLPVKKPSGCDGMQNCSKRIIIIIIWLYSSFSWIKCYHFISIIFPSLFTSTYNVFFFLLFILFLVSLSFLIHLFFFSFRFFLTLSPWLLVFFCFYLLLAFFFM